MTRSNGGSRAGSAASATSPPPSGTADDAAQRPGAEPAVATAALEAAELALIDAAEPAKRTLDDEIQALRAICADPKQPLGDRLEAFEDVFESQVGDTILSRARNIEREVGLRQIYLKFEGDNPSGTQKDRIAFSQAMDALRRGFEAITVATCGNYGVAIAMAASVAGLRCYVYVPESYHTGRIEEMQRYGAEVLRAPGDYESVVQVSRERADEDDVYDANPGGANTALQLRAYGEIAYEIYDELRDAPTAVAVSVSNGTTLAGIHKGFVSLYRRGKTSHIPPIIAGSSFGKNPIVQAFLKGAPRCESLQPEKIRETPVNEPLINWASIDGDHALEAIRDSGGWAAYASDKSMMSYSRLIREQQGLSVLPASTAGLIALLDRHQKQPLRPGRYLVILTGRRS